MVEVGIAGAYTRRRQSFPARQSFAIFLAARWLLAVCNSSALAAEDSTQTSIGGKVIRSVIVSGFGSTIESAVQNAAANALTQVVGSLVDSEKLIERQTQISDGIRAETRNITSKMREYSQGSIQSFAVLETIQDSGIVRVSAKVGVRIEDFREDASSFAGICFRQEGAARFDSIIADLV
jgi:hypothetical protein